MLYLPSSGRFTVNGVKPSASGDKSKVKVKVRVNLHGVFDFNHASLIESVKESEEPMETEQSAAGAGEQSEASESTEQAPAAAGGEEGAPAAEEKMDTSKPADSTDSGVSIVCQNQSFRKLWAASCFYVIVLLLCVVIIYKGGFGSNIR